MENPESTVVRVSGTHLKPYCTPVKKDKLMIVAQEKRERIQSKVVHGLGPNR